MKPWSERTTAERVGLVGGIAAAIIAALFGMTRLGQPPEPEPAAIADTGQSAPTEAGNAAGSAVEATPSAATAEAGSEQEEDPAATAADTEGDTTAQTAGDTADADQADSAAGTADATASAEAAPSDPATSDAATDPATTEGEAAVAIAAPETSTEPADGATTAAETAPETTAETSNAEAPAGAADPALAAAPEFDLVRVARDGSAVVAGSTAPGASVKLLLDGAEIGAVPADAQGSFVALFNLAPSTAPRILTMVAVLPDGTELAADGRIAIAPTVAPALAAAPDAEATDTGDEVAAAPDAPAAPVEEAPAALLVTDEGTRILQSAGDLSPAMASNVTVDTITYTPEGAVQLSGRGTGGAAVRLYLDNAQVADTTVDGQGGWSLTMGDVAPGLYTLRADQIGPDGQVTSRFETPFQRETAEALAAAAATGNDSAAPGAEAQGADPSSTDPAAPVDASGAATVAPAAQGPVSVTVQPGFTLWRIARENLGDGVLYVQVFEANKDKIRDPDLIYPGQVFSVPESATAP